MAEKGVVVPAHKKLKKITHENEKKKKKPNTKQKQKKTKKKKTINIIKINTK